jgi:hypothetical protein
VLPGDQDTAIKQGAGYAPQWLTEFVTVPQFAGDVAPMGRPYLALSVILFAASLLLSPNANSLHRLYRDRLSNLFRSNHH